MQTTQTTVSIDWELAHARALYDAHKRASGMLRVAIAQEARALSDALARRIARAPCAACVTYTADNRARAPRYLADDMLHTGAARRPWLYVVAFLDNPDDRTLAELKANIPQ